MSLEAKKKIAFLTSNIPQAQEACERFEREYDHVVPEEADIIVALGGDGWMLQTLHRFMGQNKSIYGMNFGSVGFLMNEYSEEQLCDRLYTAQASQVHPLMMTAYDAVGNVQLQAPAINEVSVFRQSYQAAKLRILVDGRERMSELISDGVLICTPVGSTAYNLSVHAPILPLNAQLIALTPISPFRPRHWRGALLPDQARVTIEVLEGSKRPVTAVADHTACSDVSRIDIEMNHHLGVTLLHDPGHSLEERILKEQFGGA